MTPAENPLGGGQDIEPGVPSRSDEDWDLMEHLETAATSLFHSAQVVDSFAKQRFVIGDLGSLADAMGLDEAERFLDEHSLTRISQERTARRLGRLSFDR